MAEYIDVNQIYERFFNGGSGIARIHVSDIDTLPAADVEPVVRCKDCSHCYHGELCLTCLFWHRMTNPNFYCQYGQKMDGEVTQDG